MRTESALKLKKLYVYIAGPITLGDRTQNLRQAILAGDEVLRAGHIPFIPHLNDIWHLVCPHPADDWYTMDEFWIAKCDALIRLPGASVGADAEVELANKLGLLVSDLETFLDHFDRRRLDNAPTPH